ncbi:TPA: alpha-ketoacid dehydrogenase subunit beta [Legionella pneumophila]|nr:alpha-ketoacid dehydrogenase subunit beta [Legionella pneumophila]HAT2067345.1 alpha-ketoacid dehydrogenase subunit beta [Legionella pneumophila]HAT8593494.1 alpha-ketoacid dehydrogenase subunit beta [Legionella pneumophila]HAU1577565.1 alpha-ketoacid dehydrogenase subunit beta [Legionella pneumophila]HAU1681801.1 alpha-ketoacid dehydrogenase subunit beta [Legionella pneumophila]HAU3701263.1 alpha-ketoacid dehydrogenase subunit beta [Legionella pneumophila]
MTTQLMTYREALRTAHRRALQSDPRVFLMGEDVGAYGGSYAVSRGLLQEFGPQRIRNTPLSENAFVGIGIGAALGGMRPIVEVMTINFSLLALDQIINHAATFCHMSGGQLFVPIVIRMATGAGRQVAAQHSHSFEGWYAHIPGLKILTPSTVEDALGMLKTALMDPNPVLICEHTTLYNFEEQVNPEIESVNIDKAAIRKPGTDVSIIAYSAMVHKALKAAEELSEEGINAEVIDLRTLRPLDTDTIISSVAKTHRVVVLDEGWKSGSLSAEIIARIIENAFYELDAPPTRVCTEEVPIPYPKHLEDAAVPQVESIKEACRQIVGHHV